MNELEQVKEYLQSLQSRIVAELEQIDGKQQFQRDAWDRPGGGGGTSCVLFDGSVFEQAGVGFSHVFGDQMPPSATKARPELAGRSFQAVGVSLVLHPQNPYVPTTHANFRFFTTDSGSSRKPVWWFGGGYDLTPYYPFHDDAVHWHETAKDACDPFGADLYARYKKWCDEYFYLPHRGETRGVGGLFFDDVNELGFAKSFRFLQSVGDSFLSAYRPIVKARMNHPFGERQREFQLYRRGRYVEFNLLHDRGTLFGLQSGRWQYGWKPEAGSPEEGLTTGYLRPRDWLGGTEAIKIG